MQVKEKESVKQLPKYIPAKSLNFVSKEYGFSKNEIIKLAGNENRYGCSPKVTEALERQVDTFSFYPDSNITDLRKVLSEIHNISTENFVFGNGSFELISLIADAYIDEGDEVIYSDPSFGWYINATQKNQGKLIKVPVTDEKSVDTKAILENINLKTKLIWLCNPNNPTGTVLSPDKLADFINNIPQNILIVLDEAYVDFIDGEYIDTVDFVKKNENVIILRTFSKTYGLASFRIGYGIASTNIIDNILKVKMPLNVSSASQIAALAALEDQEFTDFVIRTNNEERKYYYREFEKLGLRYVRSNGNFVLVNIGIDSSVAEQEFLKRGIMIRNGEDFGLQQWIRISIGKAEENRKVISILKEILGGGKMIIKTPDIYVSEPEVIKIAGDYISKYTKTPLIVGGKKAVDTVWEDLKESLNKNGIDTSNLEVFEGYPSESKIQKYKDQAKKINADAFIAIGGGRVLDTVKAASDLLDLPCITIPTVPATCAAWAGLTIQYDDEGAFIKARPLKHSPVLVIADTKVLLMAPRRYIFSGVVDTFAKFYEIRSSLEHATDSINLNIAFHASKLAFELLENNVFKALDESEKGIFGQAAKDVVDSIIYIAGFAGSFQTTAGYYSFAHPFYHISSRFRNTRHKLHGEKVAYGILTQLYLEKKSREENEITLLVGSRYNTPEELECLCRNI